MQAAAAGWRRRPPGGEVRDHVGLGAPEPVGDLRMGKPVGEQLRGVEVAKVVQANLGQAGVVGPLRKACVGADTFHVVAPPSELKR